MSSDLRGLKKLWAFEGARPAPKSMRESIPKTIRGRIDRTSGEWVSLADPMFEAARLAQVYDPLDPDRSDLDTYLAIVEELGARRVLDIGCGTGTFACLLASHGVEVTVIDPARASLDVARRKPGADQVRWVHGDVTQLPPLRADLATMMANVAQVFLTGEEWLETLRRARAALRPGGHLVLEPRNPASNA